MARIVCQVLHRPDRVTFVWSDGTAFFAPYHLEGADAGQFHESADQARALLAQIVHGNEQRLADLAQAGAQVLNGIFPAGQEESGRVREWLQQQADVTSFDIVSDAAGRVPWNAVYEGDPNVASLEHFWGVKYPLAVGRRVNPLRNQTAPESPEVWLVRDERAAGGVELAGARVFTTRAELRAALEDEAPDVLCLLLSANESAPTLGGETIDFAQLRDWIQNAEEGNPFPLVFLNVLDATPHWNAILQDAVAHFPGLVTWEAPGPATRELGVEAVQHFLATHHALGQALRDLRRQRGPAALALAAYAPAQFRVEQPDQPSDLASPDYGLPAEPYRPLRPFDREDRALLGGRDLDIARCAGLLDEPDTRVLFLHGASGVGKASFLRSGLLPFLEDEATGFWALRDRNPVDVPVAESDYPTVALQPGGDLLGQLAEALTAFCAQPFTFATPDGRDITVPLPSLLENFIGSPDPRGVSSTAITAQAPGVAPAPGGDMGLSTASRLWTAFIQHPGAFARWLDVLTRQLPRDLVIAVEQVEQLVSQPRTDVEIERRRQALAALQELACGPARCKVVLSLRTDFLGKLQNELPRGAEPFPAFLLPELTDAGLVEALLLPTAHEPIPYCSIPPSRKFTVAFEPGCPQLIVQRVTREARETGQSAVVLLQIVGFHLVERAKQRRESTIRERDLRVTAGAEGLLRGHVEFNMARIGLPIDLKASVFQSKTGRVLHIIRRIRAKAVRKPVEAFLRTLYSKEADGSIVRKLENWHNAVTHFRASPKSIEVLAPAEEHHLVEVNRVLVAGRESINVQLASDAVAWVANDWNEDRNRAKVANARTLDLLWIFIPLMFLVAVVTYVLTQRLSGGSSAEPDKDDKVTAALKEMQRSVIEGAWPQYQGDMALAHQAWETGNLLRMRQLLLRHQRPLNEGEDDLRSFDWRYLWRLANGERYLFQGHKAPVTVVAVAPDSLWAASASAEGTLKVWDLATGLEKATLEGHPAGIFALAFSGDSNTLASAGADKMIRLWDLAKLDGDFVNKEQKVLQGHKDEVRGLAFTKAGLVSASADKTAIVWDVATGKEKLTFKEHAAPIIALAATADGQLIATAGLDGDILLWGPADGKKTDSRNTTMSIQALAISPDKKTLLAGGSERSQGWERGAINAWQLGAKSKIGWLQRTGGQGVLALALSADGKSLVSAGKDQLLRLWQTEGRDLKELGAIPGHHGWTSAVAVSPDGRHIVSGSFDATVRAWAPEPIRENQVLDRAAGPDAGDYKGSVWALAFSADNNLLAGGGEDGLLSLWEARTGKLLHTIKDLGPIRAVAFNSSPKSPRLAVGVRSATKEGKDDGNITLFDLTFDDQKKLAAKKAHTLTEPGHGVNVLAFGANDTLLASGGADKKTILWSGLDGAKKFVLGGLPDEVVSLAFNNSGDVLAGGGSELFLRFWKTADGTDAGPVRPAHSGGVHGLAFLPRGLVAETNVPFLSVGGDRVIAVWDLRPERSESPQIVRRNRGHSEAIACIAQAGDLLVTGSWDHAITLWDLRKIGAYRGGDRLTLRGHTGAIRALALSKNQRILASAGDDGTVRLWHTAELPR